MSRDDLNINTKDKTDQTAFYYACEEGHIEIMRLLVSRDDLKINTHLNEGMTALHWACAYRNIEIVKLLMSRDDLNINAQDRHVRNEELR